MITVGVDPAASAPRTAMAKLRWSGLGAQVVELHLGVDDDAVVEAVLVADAVGIDTEAEALTTFAGQVGNAAAAANGAASCGGAAPSDSSWSDCAWDAATGIVGWGSGLWPGGFPGSVIGLLSDYPNPFGTTGKAAGDCARQ